MSDVADDYVARAEALAKLLHRGQKDKLGRSYVHHLWAVRSLMMVRWPETGPMELAAAWLHDAIEDTGATAATLQAAGMSAETVLIVEEVTRQSGVEYQRWIRELASRGSLPAVRLKLADVEHNLGRAIAVPHLWSLEGRYLRARATLESGLKRFDWRDQLQRQPLDMPNLGAAPP